MSRKRMGVIAAAVLFLVSGVVFGLARPSRSPAGDSPMARQNPISNPSPAQADPSQEAPAAQTRRPEDQNAARNVYKPARAVSAADVAYPLQTAAEGVVVFNVSLGAGGEIKTISVLKDVAPFTPVAEHSLHNWKFAAASLDDVPEDSEILVAFVFRHAVYSGTAPAFTPIFPVKESAEARDGFVPPGILSVSYAGYPSRTIAMGAVVAQASIKPDGSTGGVSLVRDLPGGFGPLAINAAKLWKFQAALRNGRPVPSKVAVAFVFSSRALNPF